MAEASTEPVKTFSIGFEHEAFDELPHARPVAEQFGTDHHEFVVRAGRGRDPAPARPPLRRAVRRLVGDPDLLPRRADPPARDGRAQRRRRRRGVRRLHALRRQPPRRPPRRAAARCGAGQRLAASARLPAGGDDPSPVNRARRLGEHARARPGRAATPLRRLLRSSSGAARSTRDEYARAIGRRRRLDVIAAPWGAASGESRAST